MRNPKFKEIKPNYRKSVLEIVLVEGRKPTSYNLPFAVFHDRKIGMHNKFTSLEIDKSLNRQAVHFVLEDGSTGDFPSDFVLYYCDPTYVWSPLNQFKRAIKDRLKQSKLSVRVLADVLSTSPSQVMRLLDEGALSKQVLQLFHIAELAGYKVEFHLKEKAA